jgi:hypothetical protein
VAQKLFAISVMKKALPKVNNHPMGEKSPNLFTLVASKKSSRKDCIQK